jgi:hypothetical protein
MHRDLSLRLTLAGLCAALVAAGCGGSSAVTSPDEAGPSARGAAILQGAILGAGIGSSSAGGPIRALAGDTGWTVSIVGTALTGDVDEDGRFLLSGAPSGSVRLRIDGPGVSAQVDVTGLVDGQVTSIEVKVTGGQAQLTTALCTPTAQTSFSGVLDKMAGTQLVVSGRNVDASQNLIVWRGDRKIGLADLQIGEKVKVWGVLRGDGVVVSEEIAALTSGLGPGSEVYVTFSGRVDSVGASSQDVHANPNPAPAKYPTLFVKQTIVIVDKDTKVKRGDGSVMSASEIQVGQHVTVEGWKRTDGAVRATRIVVG